MHPLDARHSALLIMDYQPAILRRLDDAASLLARVTTALTVARAHGMTVAYVRVGFDDADFDAVPAHAGMARAVAGAREALHSASPGTAVHDDIAPSAGDIVVRKTRVGAFSTTDLDAQLRERGVTTLVLAGISTSGVVLSTVRDAHDRDYRILVLSDACADPEPETHRVLTESILPKQAAVITTDELDGLLGSA